MENSPNINTRPMRPKFDFDAFDRKIGEVLDWYAEDAKLALAGIANEVSKLRHEQNGDPVVETV